MRCVAAGVMQCCASVILLAVAFGLTRCAADGSNGGDAGDALANVRETDARDAATASGDDDMPPHGPAFLITPEKQDDLTALSASSLTARLTQARASVNDLTGQAFAYRLEHAGDNLENDTAYRNLLRDMKAAETELFRLERERDRRAAKNEDGERLGG